MWRFVIPACLLVLVLAASSLSHAATLPNVIYLPVVDDGPSSTPTISPTPDPRFFTVTLTPTVTNTATVTPSCQGTQVQTFQIASQKGGGTQGIAQGWGSTLTAWVVVTGDDGIIWQSFSNQWQTTPYQEIDGHAMVQYFIPDPGWTAIDFYNESPQSDLTSKSVQVTYQVCTGQWPPGVTPFTTTPTVTASITSTPYPTDTITPTYTPTP